MSCQFKRRVQESTQVLRELEISLRTNHIGSVTQVVHKVMFSCIQLSRCIQKSTLFMLECRFFLRIKKITLWITLMVVWLTCCVSAAGLKNSWTVRIGGWTCWWIICLLPTALSRRYLLKTETAVCPPYLLTESNQPTFYLRLDVEGVDSSTPPPTDRHRTLEKSPEDPNRSASNSPRTTKAKTLTVRWVCVRVCLCHFLPAVTGAGVSCFSKAFSFLTSFASYHNPKNACEVKWKLSIVSRCVCECGWLFAFVSR